MHWVLAELGRQIGATARRPSRVLDIPAQLVRRRGRWRRYVEDLRIRRAVVEARAPQPRRPRFREVLFDRWFVSRTSVDPNGNVDEDERHAVRQ